jgi:hypothetical protein
MENSEPIRVCKACGFSGVGNYCSRCGQSFVIKRISLQGILRDIFHFFTHLEKGFGYTLKQLIMNPGNMQRSYIEGNRIKYQKPFSMFFICVTIAALVRYWISNALIKYYNADIVSEANFFHQYMVIMYIVLVPVYSLITYLLFYKSGYNYAETGVLMLYTVSVFFLMASIIALFILVWPHIDTAYIEFPVFAFYFIITLMNYFKTLTRWKVAIKAMLSLSIAFFINNMIEDFVIRLIS